MIAIDGKNLRIQIFEKILRVSDEVIIVAFKKQRVIIEGKQMYITYLEKNEINIMGEFLNIKFLESGEDYWKNL